MVKMTLEALLQQTSDELLRREIVQQIVYKNSNLLAIGTKIFPVKNLTQLDVKFKFPSEMAGEYPVPEGSVAALEGVIWTGYEHSLAKGQVRFMLTYESKIRGLFEEQNRMNVKRATEAMALKQDNEILAALVAGAPTAGDQIVTIAAGNEWNSGGAGADPEGDIVKARGILMDKSNVRDDEIKKLALVVGTKVSSELLKLKLIGNVQQSLESYLKSAFGITLFETRNALFLDNAYLSVMGEDTGYHGVFTGGGVPLTESQQIMGVGWQYLVTKWFGTKIVPDSTSVATSSRICKIANVAA